MKKCVDPHRRNTYIEQTVSWQYFNTYLSQFKLTSHHIEGQYHIGFKALTLKVKRQNSPISVRKYIGAKS